MGAVKSIFQGKAIRVSLVSILVTVTALLRGPLMQRASKNIIFETSVRPVMDDDLIHHPDAISSNRSMIQITTRRKTDTGCAGLFLNHTCNLKPGAVQYNVSLQGDIATLQSKSWKGDKFVKPIYAYMQDLHYPTENTVLPLWQLGTSLFSSTSWMQYAFIHDYSMNYEGLIANLYAANWTANEDGLPCYQYFNDPMNYIIDTYREIAFRMSVRAAAGPSYDYLAGQSSSVQQLPDLMQKGIPYTLHSTQVQYAADRPALVLAVIVSLVGPMAILFLFWGWWKLGRDFSMSPLEFSNAILQQQQERRTSRALGENQRLMNNDDDLAGDDMAIQDETATEMTQRSCNSVSGSDIDQEQGQHLASVFADCSGNATADELAKYFRQRGQRKNSKDGNENEEEEGEPTIQYGVVESGIGKYLGFAMVSGSQEAAAAVRQPWKGELL
ncbi:hypothetical protein NCU04607 [Neurospora crassa OR74A]|uniref:Uncharacterized protein n=1 Tax=Neurospora crassa (strain ATCC 24698 / 74-OR23-1A / CBS 708.71 / DSM 1257 / FGSC 987) TaxID=367110 RepID=Q1K6B3_NEUCR|nr:hypothetical protein NCU04607 [Neurospora crassa OR74A]EAA29614.3 hypothetical protein NCU04607 [Neurospora crassa OR74A]|eukprot:XP_958850.3 hypothetical protein NCU04607 [Neurospora crassa OR74A]